MLENTSSNEQQIEGLDIKEEVVKYLKFWPWYVLGILVCVSCAFIYLRYTTPVYVAHSRIIIKDSSDPTTEEAMLNDMGFMSGAPSVRLENELAILQSRGIMENVVNALQINVNYFFEGEIKNIEVSRDQSPILAFMENPQTSSPYNYRVTYFYDQDEIRVSNLETEKVITGNFNEYISLDFGKVLFRKNGTLNGDTSVLIKFSSVSSTANFYRSKLSISQPKESSSILRLSIQDPVVDKAQSVLDQLVIEYNQDAIKDNSEIAASTSKFINQRLGVINNELDSIEQGIETFKESNEIIDVQSEASAVLGNQSRYEQQKEEIQVQLDLAKSLKSRLQEQDEGLLPANLGFEGGVNQLISSYNQLILERDKVQAGATDLNPMVQNFNDQLKRVRENLLASLERLIQNLQLSNSNLDARISNVRNEISTVPAKEREFRGVSRQQAIKESLYLFLLQRREENSIAYGVETPKAKVVDEPYSGGKISPKSSSIYVGAALMGLMVPFLIVFAKDYLDNKIHNKKDIQSVIKDIPLVGEVPRVKKGDKDYIEKYDRSVLAESYRMLTANMQYLLAGIEKNTDRATSIFVTSTVKGEGKTFTAFNLALSLCEGQNKVLIIGADLRNPQLQRYESEAKTFLGMSDYLVNKDLSIEEVVRSSSFHDNLYLLPSGNIPPNPAELLKNKRINDFFTQVYSKYDYVIVDTAPSMLVVDTFLISKFADLTLYVVRSGFTEKKLLNFPLDAKRAEKLKNVGFVLNDVKAENFGYYGNKYGYSYGADTPKKSILKRFKKKE